MRPKLAGVDKGDNILEYSSIMLESEDQDLNQRIARRVRDLRGALGLSLEALAGRSGVSRSMLSLIERGESSPTAVVLERVATGLQVTLAALFETPTPSGDPIARHADQVRWRDPHSGYLRRNVSPEGVDTPIRIVEVQFPAMARVTYETAAREPHVYQQVWVLEGCIELTLGEITHQLHAGDCLAMTLDQPVSYYNPTQHEARYAVVIATTRPVRT